MTDLTPQELLATLGDPPPLSLETMECMAAVDDKFVRALIAECLRAREAADGPLPDIAAERRRQIEIEGWTPEHDDEHRDGDLAMAAALYASPTPLFRVYVSPPPKPDDIRTAYGITSTGSVVWTDPWPFKRQAHVRHDLDVSVNDGDKRATTDRRRNLVKAAALIVAEIERLDRAALRSQP